MSDTGTSTFTVTLTVKITQDMRDALDKHLERMRVENPTQSVSLNDTVRHLIQTGMNANSTQA